MCLCATTRHTTRTRTRTHYSPTLCSPSDAELDGLESYVLELLKVSNFDWVPRKTCYSIQALQVVPQPATDQNAPVTRAEMFQILAKLQAKETSL